MADLSLSIFEKYTDSWRIDHPDSGDVSKTTYAKGVISGFKIDDPNDMVGTIHSQVKVTGDWGESEYIPLFCHPKAQYWDDQTYKATDFDEKQVNFEKAWMSFRGGDEVAVMLKEGVPVAVIGFADGKPRVGENILKIAFETAAAGMNYMLWGFYGKGEPENYPVTGMNTLGGVLNPWNSKEVGPDNLSLGLKTECPLVASGTQNHNRNGSYLFTDYWPYTTKQAPFWYFDYGFARVNISGDGTTNYIREWLVPCGPFMYLFSILYVVSKESIALQTIGDWEYNPTHWTYEDGYSIGTTDIVVQRAIFDKDVYNMLKNSPRTNNNVGGDPWYTILPKFQLDQINTGYFKMEYYAGDPFYGWVFDYKLLSYITGTNAPPKPDNLSQDIWDLRKFVPKWETAKFLVRPHTKEELQAAGMWPQG